MKDKTQSFFITEDLSIKQAMKQMTEIGQKVLFVVDEKNKLTGALSDGDIRKWILSGGSIKEKVQRIYNKKPKYVKEKYKIEDLKHLMLHFLIECVPVVNIKGEIAEVLTWEDVFSKKPLRHRRKIKIQVVIMAGGKGTRLDPFTRVLPKPLIPIGDKPIIEIIMDKFGEYGIKEFFISLNHKSRMVKSYFEERDGRYKIKYIEEKEPLGTAGSLRFLKNKVKDPFLVTNCDVLIESDYAEIVKFHKDNKYDMTLVVSCKHYVIPYGVCEIESGGILKYINEKPEYDLLVNTGMYVIKKKMLSLIPPNQFFNINDLITKALSKGYKIGIFPISEDAWIDIGQWEEYREAIEKMKAE